MSKFRDLKLLLSKEIEIMGMGQGSNNEDGFEDGDVTLSPEKSKLAPPSMYKVILLNDDYTPMDFVVDVLRIFFNMNIEKATQIMLKVHTEGKGVCGVFTRDIAETKANQVNDYSKECEQPLLCNIEVDR